jgi:ABC-type transport system substrate-binding protein
LSKRRRIAFPCLKIETWGTQVLTLAVLLTLAGCRSAPRDPHTVVFLIESSPANLDPRVGTDGQSEHIDELLFDGLVEHDASFRFTPARADYVEAQQILARDLPAVNLWYKDTVVVHNCRLTQVTPTPSGSYTFLETAELAR